MDHQRTFRFIAACRPCLAIIVGILGIAACGPAPAPPGAIEGLADAKTEASPIEAPAQMIEDAAGLEAFLAEQGIALTFNTETELDYLPGPARIYEVEQGDSMELHSYASDAEAAAMAALVRPDARWIEDPADPDEPWYVDWKGQAQAYRSGRLLVFYIGRNDRVLELLEMALGPAFAGG